VSVSAELQAAIRAALVADAGVAALIGTRVYDGMPFSGQYPCVTFGPSDTVLDQIGCIDRREETLQLDVWTTVDQGKIWPAKTICDAVTKALNGAAISLTTNAVASVVVTSVRVLRDPDGVTAHGVVTVTAEVEAA